MAVSVDARPTEQAAVARPAVANTTRFVERWRAPLWYWLSGLALAAAVAAALHLGYSGPRSFVPYAVTVPGVAGLLWWLGKIEVLVTESTLFVDDAKIPVRLIERAVPLSPAAYRAAIGASFDPLAFVVRRPWISRAVLITLADPDDPTPYWIISSRRPEALAAAINDSRP